VTATVTDSETATVTATDPETATVTDPVTATVTATDSASPDSASPDSASPDSASPDPVTPVRNLDVVAKCPSLNPHMSQPIQKVTALNSELLLEPLEDEGFFDTISSTLELDPYGDESLFHTALDVSLHEFIRSQSCSLTIDGWVIIDIGGTPQYRYSIFLTPFFLFGSSQEKRERLEMTFERLNITWSDERNQYEAKYVLSDVEKRLIGEINNTIGLYDISPFPSDTATPATKQYTTDHLVLAALKKTANTAFPFTPMFGKLRPSFVFEWGKYRGKSLDQLVCSKHSPDIEVDRAKNYLRWVSERIEDNTLTLKDELKKKITDEMKLLKV
jgi:hypothetical protein